MFDGDVIRDLEAERRNRAKELIEDFMIAANGVTARYLKARKYPSLRRIVRSPKRWERIVEVASRYGATLPPVPDPKALAEFPALRKAALGYVPPEEYELNYIRQGGQNPEVHLST